MARTPSQKKSYVYDIDFPYRIYINESRPISLTLYAQSRKERKEQGNQLEPLPRFKPDDQYIEAELFANGFTIAQDQKKQRKPLGAPSIGFVWNCTFPHPDHHGFSIEIKVINAASVERALSPIQGTCRIEKWDHLTQQEIDYLSAPLKLGPLVKIPTLLGASYALGSYIVNQGIPATVVAIIKHWFA